jgi:protein-L-isoaspartate(D-aspartate) O-methyltransferase
VTAEARKAELILALRREGVRDMAVLEAMEWVPREHFVEPVFSDQSYADQALPIACGQTISQPFVVGLMTDRLRLDGTQKVLEIGTGSGYQTAILSLLARRVFTIERYRSLALQAGERFRVLQLANVIQLVGDGLKGWPQQAPFDRIIVTAAAMKSAPQPLVEQLAVGGVMIIPIEERAGQQDLFRVTRTHDGYDAERLLSVHFVPLVEGIAREPGSGGNS